MKRLLTVAISLSVALGSLTPALAEVAYNPHGIPQPEGTVGVTVDDGVYAAEPSIITIAHVTETWDDGKEMWGTLTDCVSLEEAPCDPSMANNKKRMVSAKLNMPMCETSSDSFCIEQVAIYQEGTPVTNAEFLGYNDGPTVPASSKLGLPKGSPVSLWKGAANHTGGTNTYAVQARAEFMLENGKFKVDRFEATVFPYVEIPNPGQSPFIFDVRPDGTQTIQGFPAGYAFVKQATAGQIHNFSLDTRVQLKLRVPNTIKGWLKGRATDPNFSASRINASSSLWNLDAKPVVVPKIRIFTTDDKRTPMMKAHPLWSDRRSQSWDNLWTSAESTGPWSMDWVQDLRKVANDTATGQAVVWQIAATSWGTGACDARAKGISGFVLTNALAYQGNTPQYRRGFLDYQVSGMHYLPDGTEALGTYDLVMDSNVARCLYGFSRAPIYGTISITGTGDKNIATTIVSEKNGWVKLAAHGFTFSQKTIRAKLTQQKPKTITCVSTAKPVKTTKVTAQSPKCPKGFKKR